MKDRDQARSYVNNFRRHFSHYLLPGITLKSSVLLVKDGGGIVRFSFSKKESEDEVMTAVKTMPEALKVMGIRTFGSGKGIIFSGTNIVLEDGSIYFVKGEDKKLWSDLGAKEDVKRIVEASRRNGA
ncbi:TPA: hypothetical protein ACP315_000193 [Pseudomonas aeruginosa]|uniref:hypothetical protein n=1 Tax=Pseudomonas aeruginosa TaxID=287 RepID=UPI0012988178|nr:hypothetical protein [Pseudomonas aeruginosa]HBO2205198.1 hypothetical protein [Pseudomonas aeruginosa]HBO5407927.1 hypothetical protein [Pseudomonas aeruginosa]HBO5640097.1 hypothetical protein [Pseudomonas aeruginosa]